MKVQRPDGQARSATAAVSIGPLEAAANAPGAAFFSQFNGMTSRVAQRAAKSPLTAGAIAGGGLVAVGIGYMNKPVSPFDDPMADLPTGLSHDDASTPKPGANDTVAQGAAATAAGKANPTIISAGAPMGPEGDAPNPFDKARRVELLRNQSPQSLQRELDLARELGVRPVQANTVEFGRMVANAELNAEGLKFVVLRDGSLRFIPKFVQGQELSHTVASGGRSVIGTGEAEVFIVNGRASFTINSHSGHYMSGANAAQNAAVQSINRAAFEAAKLKIGW